MKKLLLGLFLLSISSQFKAIESKNDTIISNVSKSVLKQLPDSSELTFKEVYSDIKSGLTALGSSLKVGSEHVYEVLVKQQYVYSIVYTLLIILSIILMIICCKAIPKLGWRDDYYYQRDWENKGGYEGFKKTQLGFINIIYIILAIISLIGLIFGFLYMDQIITGFINPEYGAIKEILEVIK